MYELKYAPYVRNPEYDHMEGCRNCGGDVHADHDDLCCTCFGIAFGSSEHRDEHRRPCRPPIPAHV